MLIAKHLMQLTRVTSGKHTYMLRLFSLASDGVYLAAPVTSHAVRSYRTFSTLPVPKGHRPFKSLQHFPLARATQTLSGVVFS